MLILLLIGILLIVFSKEKSIEVSYKKSLDEKICSRFGFKNTTEVKLLCDYISTATTQFNKSNNCNISNEKVTDFFFTKFKDDVPFFTINDIQNKHFGFLYYSYMCCFMFFDKKYAEMKEQFASDVEIFVPNQ